MRDDESHALDAGGDGPPPGLLLLRTTADPAVGLIRLVVGWVFLVEGALKLLQPGTYGAGRFEPMGLPLPDLLGPLVGMIELGCGALVLVGLATRIAVLPLISFMLMALWASTLPILRAEGIFEALHRSHLEVVMLVTGIVLLMRGAGPWSLDLRAIPAEDPE
jgi:putative oxidoreductase